MPLIPRRWLRKAAGAGLLAMVAAGLLAAIVVDIGWLGAAIALVIAAVMCAMMLLGMKLLDEPRRVSAGPTTRRGAPGVLDDR